MHRRAQLAGMMARRIPQVANEMKGKGKGKLVMWDPSLPVSRKRDEGQGQGRAGDVGPVAAGESQTR